MDRYQVNHEQADSHEIVLTLIKQLAKIALKNDDYYFTSLTHISHIAAEALVEGS